MTTDVDRETAQQIADTRLGSLRNGYETAIPLGHRHKAAATKRPYTPGFGHRLFLTAAGPALPHCLKPRAAQPMGQATYRHASQDGSHSRSWTELDSVSIAKGATTRAVARYLHAGKAMQSFKAAGRLHGHNKTRIYRPFLQRRT